MKNKKYIIIVLCLLFSVSAFRSALAYSGIAVGDNFVWKMEAGEEESYIKFTVESVDGDVVIGEIFTYDPDGGVVITHGVIPYWYSETLITAFVSVYTYANETRTYGGVECDCYVLTSGLTGFTGDFVLDSETGIILEFSTDFGTDDGSFTLVSWEDQDLETEYAKGGNGIPGYSLTFLIGGIFVSSWLLYRKIND